MSESMSDYHVPVTVQGHYVCDDTPSDILLVGFHGYGGTAAAFSRYVHRLSLAERACVCSLQALHPFYHADGQTLGASWMTSYERESTIAANNAYVLTVVRAMRERMSATKIILCGFSQGASLVCRAAVHLHQQGIAVHTAIMVGGDIPAEISAAALCSQLYLCRGASDELYTRERHQADMHKMHAEADTSGNMQGTGICQAVHYTGGHVWNRSCVAAIDGITAHIV